MDRARVGGPRWTRDRNRVARSPERGLPAMQSPGARRELGKTERSSGGVLTEGFGSRIDGEARTVAVKGERRR